mmetsp:Transcript_50816/g.147510  ORF Transcript_50816/g.147510 Transcript_50816/m.147510 type:complete len:215 (+) Transcript_50816:249-893(+)
MPAGQSSQASPPHRRSRPAKLRQDSRATSWPSAGQSSTDSSSAPWASSLPPKRAPQGGLQQSSVLGISISGWTSAASRSSKLTARPTPGAARSSAAMQRRANAKAPACASLPRSRKQEASRLWPLALARSNSSSKRLRNSEGTACQCLGPMSASRTTPGLTLEAIMAASSTKVPLPHMGSSKHNGSPERTPASNRRPAALVSRSAALCIFTPER